MFSGIIERVGEVAARVPRDNGMSFDIATGYTDLALGESVAVNGVCLTVEASDEAGRARFYASTETLSRTNLGALETGSAVNLERAVSLSTRLSGHMVQGHVDGLARLVSLEPDGVSWRLGLMLPPALGRYAVEKGSLALDGISLTLNEVADLGEGTRIGLTIIPHTFAHTNLGRRQVGDELNVEVDIIAKYVERLCTR